MTHLVNHRAFFELFNQAMVGYLFDLGGLFAGFVLAFQLNVFNLAPWAIAVYPAIVSAKGVIGGLLSGRLSTALHVGTIYPRLFKNTATFYTLYKALVFLTLLTSVGMSLVSMLFGWFFWGITASDFLPILLVVISTMMLGLMLTLVTTTVAFTTFKRGFDPDVVVYPIMSTTADIFITVCYVVVLNLFFFHAAGRYILTLACIAYAALVVIGLRSGLRNREFVKTVKEALFPIVFVSFIVNVTGTVLKRISVVVETRLEVYTVYPALIDMVGDVGSVVGSTATTKLALGLIKPSLTSMRKHAAQILSAWAASMVIFIVIAALSIGINGLYSLHAFLGLTAVLLVTNVLAVAAIVLVSFAIAILTFQRNLDPDNFVIPIESSLADSLTSIALLIALFIVG